jgi:hypothetical protein
MMSLLTSATTVGADGTFRIRVRCGWQRDCHGAIAILRYVTDQSMSQAIAACADKPVAHRDACMTDQFRLGGSDFAVGRMSTASIPVALNQSGLRALRRSGTLAPDIAAHIKGDHAEDVIVVDFRPQSSPGVPRPFTLTAHGS